MSNNAPTKNVMKEDFGWEIPVETVPLPSKGIIYSPDSTLYNRETLQIKAMTAQEEDILASQAYIKEGTVVLNLIKSCISDKSIDVDSLIAGDRNALMVSIRITGYGPEYNVGHTCVNCGKSNQVIADLSQLSIKRLKEPPTKLGENIFSFKLPVTGKTVDFKFLDGYDKKEIAIKEKRLKGMGIYREQPVTSYLENVIVSIDGVTDKNKITHFVKNMPARDSKKLRDHIQDLEPGIDMSWKYICESCNSENNFNIPVTPEFFWPST